VGQVAAGARELERELDFGDCDDSSDGGTGGPDLGPTGGTRLARMEARLESLGTEVEAVRRAQRQMLGEDVEDGSLDAAPALEVSFAGAQGTQVGPGSAAGAAGPAGVASLGGGAKSPANGASPATTPVGKKPAVAGMGALANTVKDMGGRLEHLQDAMEGILSGKVNIVSEETLIELDSRFESRLTSVWKELKKYADSAATRADRLEQHMGGRVGKLETTWAEFLDKKKTEKELEEKLKELAKLIEWLTWRITWLEWACKGEERGFGRPLDEKDIMHVPPPGTVAATAFAQPLTEDCELWARAGSSQRLRRPMPTPIVEPGSFGSSTGIGRQLAQAYRAAPSQMRASRGSGSLPKLA